jgi:hypothetical protein
VLGFAVIGGGLILGAMNPDPVAVEVEATEEGVEEAAPSMHTPIFAQPSHAPLPATSDRRPPATVRTVQK